MTRQEEFKQKLLALLREYNVTMCVEDPYGSPHIDFFAYSVWDENHNNIIHDCINFQTTYENGKE